LIFEQILAGERRDKENQKTGGYTAGDKFYSHYHISIQDGHNFIFLSIPQPLFEAFSLTNRLLVVFKPGANHPVTTATFKALTCFCLPPPIGAGKSKSPDLRVVVDAANCFIFNYKKSGP
jgi:hypothetical protein